MLRALENFPQMNNGFEVIDGQPARVKRESVNLGIAIDLEKKDGTRSLVTAFRKAGSNALIDELDRVVTELEHLSK